MLVRGYNHFRKISNGRVKEEYEKKYKKIERLGSLSAKKE